MATSATMLAKIVGLDDESDWSGYVLITYALIFGIGGTLIRLSL